MNRITLLPPDVAQKIAAGEVIERPFSVVKELVENSLDARSTEIKVELIDGGKKLIRVTDNGFGMSREDARVAFERHSTSKIASEADLERIKTLGFRGEALPSISAVSRVILKTAEAGQPVGTLIERAGEEVIRVTDIAFPHGTSVEVTDLFFNLPARRKFLRGERSELGQVVNYLSQAALAFPRVRFSLFHGQRKVFDYPVVNSLKERIYQVHGSKTSDRLIEINYEEDDLALFGYASKPPTGRRDRRQQLFFVNGRPVREKTIQAALNQSYRGFLEKDHSAECFLFLSLPYGDVDVNVHPTKTEVRFKDSSSVYSFVHRCLEQALLKAMGVKDMYPLRAEELPSRFVAEFPRPRVMPKFTEQTQEVSGLFPSGKAHERAGSPVLGQYDNMYIVVADEDGLLIIDQHNAHERILYDRYMAIDSRKKWPQKLALLPVVFDLSPTQTLSLEDNRALLEEGGFRFEAMGGRSIALKEYPGILKEGEAKDIFLSLLEEMRGEAIADKKKKLLATLACKTAVKAGEPLPKAKMEYLFEELYKTSNFSLCPHGRPITVKIQKGKIEKGLRRGQKRGKN